MSNDRAIEKSVCDFLLHPKTETEEQVHKYAVSSESFLTDSKKYVSLEFAKQLNEPDVEVTDKLFKVKEAISGANSLVILDVQMDRKR